MMFDALVIGSELDGWVAATRLLELGHSVCVVASGEGSLHYAPGGIHVLGYVNGTRAGQVIEPMGSMAELDGRHPYRLAGNDNVRAALNWFKTSALGVGFGDADAHDSNRLTVTPAGITLSALFAGNHQATADQIYGQVVTVMGFRGHRDFPSGLVTGELRRRGERVNSIDVDAPDGRTDSVAIAGAFDAIADVGSWFADLKRTLPADTETLLVPAVLGYKRHHETMTAASQALGLPVFEVPTLPPCLPGMRLAGMCESHVRQQSGVVRFGCRVAGMDGLDDRAHAVTDSNGRTIEAMAFVLATGGVLMGGLEVDSHGRVSEPVLGLDVHQTEPLSQAGSAQAVAALHCAGVETDNTFRPSCNGGGPWQNLFVTGRTLAHWDPGAEISAEGVAIVSGWVAAEAAHLGLVRRKP